MESIDGRTLSESWGTWMPVRQLLHVVMLAAGALAEAHEHGVVHRDLIAVAPE